MAVLDSLLGVVNVAFFYTMLVWLLVDSLKEIRHNRVLHLKKRGFTKGHVFLATTTVLSNAIISVLNIGFTLYEYRSKRIITGYNSVSLALTWVLATLVSLYSTKRIFKEKNKGWPLVLILWWVFATISDAISVFLKLTKDLKSLRLSFFLSEDNIVDVFSFPLLLLLCFNVVWAWKTNDMEEQEPLLQKELPLPSSLEEEDEEAFTNASIWSKLTFLWLNRVFKRGRIQKLELHHVPSVPHSETAENACSMLEESLGTQKPEAVSLTKAIFHSIWKSLVFNAVFAGKVLLRLPFQLEYFISYLLLASLRQTLAQQ